MKYALRGVGQNDAHGLLERAYRVRDPWALDTPAEHHRFAETNRALQAAFGTDVDRLLEIGCGEGLQSAALAGVCRRLTGVDVSETAVGRARERVPSAEFAAGDLFAQPWAGETGRFDVVVACEVLYYLSDVPRTLEAMERLARRGCLVTYFAPAERKLGAHLAGLRGVVRSSIRHGAEEWIVAAWSP
jgi:predicted TPR repeat methyltransferase